MTLLWLSKHAEISAYTVGNDYLEIHASDSSYRRAIYDNSFIGFVKLASADPYRVTSSWYRAEGRSTNDRLTDVWTTYPDVFRLPTSGLALTYSSEVKMHIKPLRDGVPSTQMENILTGI